MATIGPSIPTYTFYPDAPPAVVGKLTPGKAVTIELWVEGEEVALVPPNDVCVPIGDTGKYVFSTSKLPPMRRSREQYHYRMSDGEGGSDEGDFILEVEQIVMMPSIISDRSSFIKAL